MLGNASPVENSGSVWGLGGEGRHAMLLLWLGEVLDRDLLSLRTGGAGAYSLGCLARPVRRH